MAKLDTNCFMFVCNDFQTCFDLDYTCFEFTYNQDRFHRTAEATRYRKPAFVEHHNGFQRNNTLQQDS